MNTIISVKKLTKRFKNLTAVNEVSFNVNEGEIFGFLGPNGAGKTTTIDMLCTLLSPTSGEAVLNGYDVTKNRNKVRQCIGLVFQDPSLDDWLTAKENLEFHAMVYNIERKIAKKRIDEVLEIVELKDRKNDLVLNFSGGMKRRLEIARGLIHYPKVLFLDEPTLGLDPQTRNRVWEYIRDLKEKENITIFLTTHYMDEAENCDRIAIIDVGKIIAMDTPINLKKRVRGDIITVETSDNRSLNEELKKKKVKNIIFYNNKIQFEVYDSEKFIPKFIKESKEEIISISARKPTLDDVFLSLTGKKIREETVSGLDRMRKRFKMGRMRR
ncbi:MAG: ATP-binding cassette domain-containing protein [Actinomycetia bacterium]|nr:ATP-binding cassette domain-containing protein [Actinomycetes bacterium]